jgi:hypothetical protein
MGTVEELSGGLVEEAHECLLQMELYLDPLFYFGDILSLLTTKEIRYLLRRIGGAGHATKRELAASVSDMLKSALHNIGTGSRGLQYFLKALDPHLANPKLCAQIMSRKSFLDVSISIVIEEARGLNAEIRSHGLKDLELALDETEELGLEFEGRDYIVGESESATVYEFLKCVPYFCSEDIGTVSIWNGFRYLYARAEIEKRHPLYPTKYSLYLPRAERHWLADPVEQIILESTANPSLIRALSPREFEVFLAKIFESFGFDVHMTARTRDGGVDILCMTKQLEIPFKVAIEAKRYHPSKPVTVNLIRSFVGANKLFQANKLVYVTTSRYTRDAIKYSASPFVAELLELKQLPDIVKWANEFRKQRFPCDA